MLPGVIDQSVSALSTGEIPLFVAGLFYGFLWVAVPWGDSYCFLSPRLTDTCPVDFQKAKLFHFYYTQSR